MAGERADLQPAGGNRILETPPCRVVLQQRGGIRVLRAGISPDPDLDRLATRGLDVVQRLLERALAEQHREDPDLHAQILPSSCRAGPAHAGPRIARTLPDNQAACQPADLGFARRCRNPPDHTEDGSRKAR